MQFEFHLPALAKHDCPFYSLWELHIMLGRQCDERKWQTITRQNIFPPRSASLWIRNLKFCSIFMQERRLLLTRFGRHFAKGVGTLSVILLPINVCLHAVKMSAAVKLLQMKKLVCYLKVRVCLCHWIHFFPGYGNKLHILIDVLLSLYFFGDIVNEAMEQNWSELLLLSGVKSRVQVSSGSNSL